MSESSKTWIPLKKEFDKIGWHYTRIENNVGIPDLIVYVPEQKRDVWIELKYCKDPGDSEAIDIGLRKEQFITMRQMYNAGRSVILLARINDTFYVWNDVLSWEMAKKPQQIGIMAIRSEFRTRKIDEIIDILKERDFTKSK